MDKTTLHKAFSKAYDHEKWLEVLQSVFGSKQLFSQPKPIILPNNDRTSAAFELGSLTTSDDRIIGLYRIDVKPEVWLERNKVSLRELLRNVYKYDVDGAIVVFVQEEKWRLSFISEIKVLNDEGEVLKQATESKRYTYLLGEGEKVRTPADRLSKLSGKTLSLQDVLNAFSVESLNEEFYKIVQEFFYRLVGGQVGKGRKNTDFGDGILQLPSTPKENRQTYQEFAVRLIGRTVFCWFLKMKKSESGKPLLPESLLSSQAVKGNNGYYHTILERLFFQTLNTPMEERVENLPDGAEIIPFLNGGLFEPGTDDFYMPNKITGLNEHLNTLKITDQWFVEFFEEIEKYNFTIDENSVTEVEVSVDPEMLGRIFENLLAEIDPDSGDTARKATGSFYTPREIVDYMAAESLVQYLHNKTDIDYDKLRPIFKMLEQEDIEFFQTEKENILDALDKIKILDPACGSGAFPMGVLQKIVQALQKLDKDALWWKKRQVDRISNAIVRKQLKEKLESSGVEYARKIGVIQNSLYGVDIQSIAAEISKLRCFLSLIVDETIDENKPNRGIEPLPNLEFKFVTADTLTKLPESDIQRSLYDNLEELQELEELRDEYIQSYGNVKLRLKERFLKVQQKVAKDQLSLFANQNSKASKIGNWNPFGHEKSDWFDPKWMFGVEKFDVVIGNPPYGIKYSKDEINKFRKSFSVVVGHSEAYYLFTEKAFSFLDEKGIVSYIIPNAWMSNKYAMGLRNLLLNKKTIKILVNLNKQNIFNNAVVENSILFAENIKTSNIALVGETVDTSKLYPFDISCWSSNENYLINFSKNPSIENLLHTIRNRGTKLSMLFDVSNGFKPYQVGYGKNLSGLPLNADDVKNKIYHSLESFDSIHKKQLKGKNIIKYHLNWGGEYIKWGNWLMSPKQKKYFEEPKILIRQIIGETLLATFDDQKYYADQTLYVIINYPEEQRSLKFYTALLNSKTIGFYFRKFYSEEDDLFPKIKVNELKDLPLFELSDNQVFFFEILVDYIIFLKRIEDDNILNTHVSNSHIAQLFEEVIDAMVMELYFKDDFEKAGIEFIKYAERDFESIENKSESEQIEIIHKAYQKLREKDNEIRNNLKLMDTRLTDIVMPIKTAK